MLEDWRNRPPAEPPIVGVCAHCGGELYEGDDIYECSDGDSVHVECWEVYVDRQLEPTHELGRCACCGGPLNSVEDDCIIKVKDGEFIHEGCLYEYAEYRLDARLTQAEK